MKHLYNSIQAIALFSFFLLISGTSVMAQQSISGILFDGIDDVATAPHNSAMDLGTGQFTIEAWIKASPNAPSTYPTICAKRDPQNSFTGFIFAIRASNGTLWMQVEGTNYLPDLGPNLLDGQCHHIAVTRTTIGGNVDSLRYYVDGVKIGSDAIGATKNISSPGMLAIGGDLNSPSGHIYSGDIKELRIWSNSLSGTAISASMNTQVAGNSGNLVAYYQLDEGSGQNLYDSSPNGNHGVLGYTSGSESGDPTHVSSCPIDMLVGIEEGALSPVLVNAFPNPTQGNVTVTTDAQIQQVRIIDLTGNLVYTKGINKVKNYTFDISQLRAGIYFLEVMTDKGIATKRMVKR